MKCKCGTEYSLESYHDNDPDRDLCHTCYRKLFSMFDIVKTNVKLKGFNHHYLTYTQCAQGDILMVLGYNFHTQHYTLVGGGFYFMATHDQLRQINASGVKYIKEYKPISTVEWLLGETTDY